MAIRLNLKRMLGPIVVVAAGILVATAIAGAVRIKVADAGSAQAGAFGTLQIDPGPIAAASCGIATRPALGIKAGDHVIVLNPPDLEPGLIGTASTQGTNDNLSVRMCNITAAALDGGSKTWAYMVVR